MSPSDASVSAAGVTATSLTTWSTVTDAVPETPPTFAVIVAVPLATAVTTPDAPTVATEGLPLDHVSATSVIGLPYWSRTPAPSCTVAPNAVSSDTAGVTVNSVAAGGSVPHADRDAAPANPSAWIGIRRPLPAVGHELKPRRSSKVMSCPLPVPFATRKGGSSGAILL